MLESRVMLAQSQNAAQCAGNLIRVTKMHLCESYEDCCLKLFNFIRMNQTKKQEGVRRQD